MIANLILWRVFAGIPLVVVIIVIAVNKDYYGLITYGNISDGSTDL